MRESHAYSDANCYIHADSNTDCDGNRNSYRHVHANSDSHSYSYSNSYGNSNRYGHGHGYRDGDRTAAAYPDAESASDATSAPLTVTGTIKAGTRERKLASSLSVVD